MDTVNNTNITSPAPGQPAVTPPAVVTPPADNTADPVPPVAPPAADDQAAGDDMGVVDDSRLAEMETALAAAQAEVESARRHCAQRDNEIRKLKRMNLTDPEALEELEREVEEERERVLQEAQEARVEYAIKSNTLDVKNVFLEAGITSADCTKLAGYIVCEDSAESTARAKALVSVINKVANGKVKEATAEMLRSNAEEPPHGGDVPAAPTVSRGAAAAQRYIQSHINNIGGKS